MRRGVMTGLGVMLMLGAPALASEGASSPCETALGLTFGIPGMGLAWRHDLLPNLGVQVGGSTWGSFHSFGGQLNVHLLNFGGFRLTAHAGAAQLLGNVPFGASNPLWAAVGGGLTLPLGDRVRLTLDSSIVSTPQLMPEILRGDGAGKFLPSAMAGLMFRL